MSQGQWINHYNKYNPQVEVEGLVWWQPSPVYGRVYLVKIQIEGEQGDHDVRFAPDGTRCYALTPEEYADLN